jgi:hypothetical protein
MVSWLHNILVPQEAMPAWFPKYFGIGIYEGGMK